MNPPLICDDSDSCTIDICVQGICVYITDTACVNPCDTMSCNDNDACTTDTCINGNCANTQIICDDLDPCTNDACVGGLCQYTPMVCDDGDICTSDTCDNTGCVFTPIVPCNDPCDTLDCNDNDPCTNDDCVNGNCVNLPVVCDDGNACTNDVCVNGACTYTLIDCDDNIACTLDSCQNGVCSNAPITIDISGIYGPTCIEDETRPVYSVNGFPTGYQYHWSVSRHGEIPDTAQGYSETLVHCTGIGRAVLSVVVSIGACSDSASLEVQVVEDASCCPDPCPNAINNLQQNIETSILPNPNTGEFFVIVEAPATIEPGHSITFEISDVSGKSIYHSPGLLLNQRGGSFGINLSGYSKGVYFLSVNAGNSSIKKKIFIY